MITKNKTSIFKSVLCLGIFTIGSCTSPAEIVQKIQKRPKIKSKTIVFIHGMYMTPECWADWQKKYKKLGFKVLAPAWPGRANITIKEMRKKHPDPNLAKLSLQDLVDHYSEIVKKLPEPPILIGHSMGGLVVQLLLQKNLGDAGIAISSAPPEGFVGPTSKWAFKISFVKANWEIGPMKATDEPYFMSFEDFQYGWAHTLSKENQESAYEKYVVPESRLVGSGPTTNTATIDFKKNHAPLLFISGTKDRTIPIRLNQDNYSAYFASESVVDFKEFPNRTHLILNQKGWTKVADYIMGWIKK